MNETAHRTAIGAVLTTPIHAEYVLSRLTPDDFQPGWLQTIFTVFGELHAEGVECTPMQVLMRLQATGRVRPSDQIGILLADLYEECPISLDPEQVCLAVLEQSFRWNAWQTTTRIRQGCTEWSTAALLATIERELAALVSAARRFSTDSPQERVVKSGVPGLDSILDGYVPGSPAA